MPDVIIKGMKDPPQFCTNGYDKHCPMWSDDGAGVGCALNNYYRCDPDLYGWKRPNWCPLRPAPEWISVEDRLPEIKEGHCSDTVLVYLEGGGMAFTDLEETFFGDFVFGIEKMDPNGEYGPEVTHWMPLPEPPKEVQTDG